MELLKTHTKGQDNLQGLHRSPSSTNMPHREAQLEGREMPARALPTLPQGGIIRSQVVEHQSHPLTCLAHPAALPAPARLRQEISTRATKAVFSHPWNLQRNATASEHTETHTDHSCI